MPSPPILDAHNRARAEHCADPLVWSPELAEAAQRWAEHLAARRCALAHSEDGLGENLAGGTGLTGEQAVEMWMRERAHYRFASGGFSMATGHFTQVVWSGTSRVGCGSVECSSMVLWVCKYDPPGNVQGGYRENVHAAGDCG
jgi:hypothetical protein